MTAIALSGLYLATGVALGAIVSVAGLDVVEAGVPYDALPATLSTAVELVRHNLVVAIWPLALVALGWPAIPVARQVGDALVTGQLLLHGSLVGSALVQQPAIWRFLPHLPLEWLALAIPVAMWIDAYRDHTPPAKRLLAAAAGAAVLLAVAAAIET